MNYWFTQKEKITLFCLLAPIIAIIAGIYMCVEWYLNPHPHDITYTQLLKINPNHGFYTITDGQIDYSMKNTKSSPVYYAIRGSNVSAKTPVRIIYEREYAIPNDTESHAVSGFIRAVSNDDAIKFKTMNFTYIQPAIIISDVSIPDWRIGLACFIIGSILLKPLWKVAYKNEFPR